MSESIVAERQVARIVKCPEVQLLARDAIACREVLPSCRLTDCVADLHPFLPANGEDRPWCELGQPVRAGDDQVVEGVCAIEFEGAMVGVVEEFIEEVLGLLNCFRVIDVGHCFCLAFVLVRCSVDVVYHSACVRVSYEDFPHFLVGAPTSHCVDPALWDVHVFHTVHDDDRAVGCGRGNKAGEVDGVADVRRVGVDCVGPLTCCAHCCFPYSERGAPKHAR